MRYGETRFSRWMYYHPFAVIGVIISSVVGAGILAIVLGYWEKNHCQRHSPETVEYYRTMRDGAVNPSAMDRYNGYYMAEELRVIRMELQTLNSNITALRGASNETLH